MSNPVIIELEISSCRHCPHFKEGHRQSTDGFDSGYDWFCTHNGNKRMISGFVEWHELDKIEIPNWCPFKKK